MADAVNGAAPDDGEFSLASLRMVETYVEYDRPVLYSCQAKNGQLYLVTLLDDEEYPVEQWLVAPIDRAGLLSVRSGARTIHQAFSQPPGGQVRILTTEGSTTKAVETVEANQLRSDQLPAPAARLDMATPAEPLARSPHELANKENRDVLLLAVEFGLTPGVAPVSLSSKVMVGFQKLVHRLSMKINDSSGDSDRIQSSLAIRDSDLELFAISPGSFGMHFLGSQLGDLFGRTFVGSAIERLASIIDAVSDDEEFAKALKGFEGKPAKEIRSFFSQIASDAGSMRLEWVGPRSRNERRLQLDTDAIRHLIRQLEAGFVTDEYETTVNALVMGVNKRLGTFEIEIESGEHRGKIWKGRFDKEALETLANVTLGPAAVYQAQVKVTCLNMPYLQQTKNEYVLLSLTHILPTARR